MTDLLNGIAALSHLGVIRVAGEDAGAVLHSQLTQDFSSLDMRQARLAAFLSAKGRMQASFIGLRRPDEWLLLCSRDLLPAPLARPSLFVLRAQAPLTDPTAPLSPSPPGAAAPPAFFRAAPKARAPRRRPGLPPRGRGGRPPGARCGGRAARLEQ